MLVSGSGQAQAGCLPLGASTLSFMWRRPVMRSLCCMRAAGWNNFDCVIAPGHLHPDEMNSGDCRNLKRQFEQDEILIDSLNSTALNLNLSSSDRDEREHTIRVVGKILRLARDIDARAVVISPGRTPALQLSKQADDLEWLGDSVEKLLNAAASLEVTLLLRAQPQTLICDAKGIADFVDRFRSPYVKIAYDISAAERVGEDKGAAIRMFGDRVQQVHFSEFRKRRDLLGRILDLRPVLSAIANISFEGVVILYIDSDCSIDDAKSSIERLNELDPSRRVDMQTGNER